MSTKSANLRKRLRIAEQQNARLLRLLKSLQRQVRVDDQQIQDVTIFSGDWVLRFPLCVVKKARPRPAGIELEALPENGGPWKNFCCSVLEGK